MRELKDKNGDKKIYSAIKAIEFSLLNHFHFFPIYILIQTSLNNNTKTNFLLYKLALLPATQSVPLD